MARATVQVQVNPLLSLSYTNGRCWLSCPGCEDSTRLGREAHLIPGTTGHWHEISKGLARCLTADAWQPWAGAA